ncbi:MAG TPA: flavodoxin family protein [Candidatus Gemmiger faecavium]|nr:flavodoxin family protein [Candidatus Gemmiger faecavium]
MSYSIVYSSRTGNTALLAQTIRDTLPASDCVYFGAPDAKALAADTIYAGFWTDKGTCDEQVAQFLQSLNGQKVFLFGTAGFGGAPAYFEQILNRVRENLPETTELIGSYMCQGKMPAAVRARYEAMEDNPRRAAMIENFDRALSHPDAQDLDALANAVRR